MMKNYATSILLTALGFVMLWISVLILINGSVTLVEKHAWILYMEIAISVGVIVLGIERTLSRKVEGRYR